MVRSASDAQAALSELEKRNAPAKDQILQAATFSGIDAELLDPSVLVIKDLDDGVIGDINSATRSIYHGREEWTLRWLLKKLVAAPKAGTESSTAEEPAFAQQPEAWILLARLLERIPLRSAARALNERKFTALLEYGVELLRRTTESLSGPKDTPKKEKKSKKRRRDGTPVSADGAATSTGTLQLRSAIWLATATITRLGSASDTDLFEVEYMKSVLKTSTGEAAKILGGWLAALADFNMSMGSLSELLGPFTTLWTSRIIGADDSAVFSQNCLQNLLQLLSREDLPSDARSQFEKLLARNVIVPARAAHAKSGSTDSLKDLVGESIGEQVEYADLLFDIAIRSVVMQSNRRRKPNDAAWLQSVFTTIQHILIATPKVDSQQAIQRMLNTCFKRDVNLDLSTLRSLISQLACNAALIDWAMVSIAIKLESNVFLIAEDEIDLLPLLFSRITEASKSKEWHDIAGEVVDGVLFPLMEEFARARKLTAFVRAWYEQLVSLQAYYAKADSQGGKPRYYSAWEDEAVQLKFGELMEASLGTQQILDLVEFLREHAGGNTGAVYVLADAVAGAVKKEEIVDNLGLSLFGIATTSVLTLEIYSRYAPHQWRTVRRTLEWKTPASRSPEWLIARSQLLSVCKNSLLENKVELLSPVVLEVFRCLCVLVKATTLVDADEKDLVWTCLKQFVSPLEKLFHSTAMNLSGGSSALGKIVYGQRLTSIPDERDGTGYLACSYAHCLLVEYPQVLSALFGTTVSSSDSTVSAIVDLIWIASAASPHAREKKGSWLRKNGNVLPRMWLSFLENDYVLNDAKLIGAVVDTLLRCATHQNNPISASTAINGFAIRSLSRLPVEVFNRGQRELILTSWQPETLMIEDSDHISSYTMATYDPAVLSLKMKMMQRPTLYDGICFDHIIQYGKSLAEASDEPMMALPIYAEHAKLTLGHIMGTMDQKKSSVYLGELTTTVGAWIESNKKAKETLPFMIVKLMEVCISAMLQKAAPLESNGLVTVEAINEMATKYKQILVLNLRRLIKKPSELEKSDGERSLSLSATLDALDSLKPVTADLSVLDGDSLKMVAKVRDSNKSLGDRLEMFMVRYDRKSFGEGNVGTLLCGNTSTEEGRSAVRRKVTSVTADMKNIERLGLVLELLQAPLPDTETHTLDALLAVRHAVSSCEDSREVFVQIDGENLTLSSIYSTLTKQMSGSNGFREFCIISEILEIMLRTKSRVISQYNIDTTLSSICTVCSRSGPSLPPRRAGSIFLHLCRLLQAVLLSHRLKLQGHFHLVVQVMQALLHCLYTPVSSTSTLKTTYPPWSTPTGYQLSLLHARAFTRLLTLLCDPSTSSVSRSSTTSLNSATAKAKRFVGQHIPTVLACYIKLQLDLGLKMRPDVREALTPGVWAVFDTMSVEGRRVLGESLDASGRAVLGGMIREWSKFGKWKGS